MERSGPSSSLLCISPPISVPRPGEPNFVHVPISSFRAGLGDDSSDDTYFACKYVREPFFRACQALGKGKAMPEAIRAPNRTDPQGYLRFRLQY